MKNQHHKKEDKQDLVFGIRAVIEAIKSKKEINKILIQSNLKGELFKDIQPLLKGLYPQIQYVPIEKLNRLTRSNHQGMVAFISPVSYHKIEKVLEKITAEKEQIKLLMLDRVTDVRNFGSIARSAECFGFDAIIVPHKNSALITADAVKTSAGALHKIPVCKVENLVDTVYLLQQYEIKMLACTEKATQDINEAAIDNKTCVIMGSEENGITPMLIKIADQSVKIPMTGTIESLNVSVSAGIVMHSVLSKQMNN